jgi:hypothetical protein
VFIHPEQIPFDGKRRIHQNAQHRKLRKSLTAEERRISSTGNDDSGSYQKGQSRPPIDGEFFLSNKDEIFINKHKVL